MSIHLDYRRLREIHRTYAPVKSDSAVAKCAYLEQRRGRASVKARSRTLVEIKLTPAGRELLQQSGGMHDC